MNYTDHYNTRVTPQSEPIPGSEQVLNSAEGYSFAVDDWKRLERFLILGSEGGSYYASERELTRENAQAIERCIHVDGYRVVRLIHSVSESGRAPKQDPTLFALAMCLGLGDVATKQAVAASFNSIVRTGSHLFRFVSFCDAFRGWGHSLKRVVANWYLSRSMEDLQYQVIKYRQRYGYTHRDLLRLSHPEGTGEHAAIFSWLCKPDDQDRIKSIESCYRIAAMLDAAKKDTSMEAIASLVMACDLPREAVPTYALNSPIVWFALLERMPMTAMIRNLGKMSSIGMLLPLSDAERTICTRLRDRERIRKSRLHPVEILIALRTYASGHGDKGSLKWMPNRAVIDALNDAFYLAFANVEPTGQRIMLAVDVSASMAYGAISGSSLSARDASAALALVTMATEPNAFCTAFTGEFVPLPISPRQRLDDVIQMTSNLNFGATDCAIPMLYASDKKLIIDVFVVLTDSETWIGKIHPAQALRDYRSQFNQRAKLIVVAMKSNGFTIADPDDAGMLDVVGMDASVPALIADFIR